MFRSIETQKTEASGMFRSIETQKTEAHSGMFHRSETRGQRSEVREQKSEIQGQRSEVRDQRSEILVDGELPDEWPPIRHVL